MIITQLRSCSDSRTPSYLEDRIRIVLQQNARDPCMTALCLGAHRESGEEKYALGEAYCMMQAGPARIILKVDDADPPSP